MITGIPNRTNPGNAGAGDSATAGTGFCMIAAVACEGAVLDVLVVDRPEALQEQHTNLRRMRGFGLTHMFISTA
jgi:hypothetical protein